MEQSVDVGDVWSLLVQLRSLAQEPEQSRSVESNSNVGIVERSCRGPSGGWSTGDRPSWSISSVPIRLADDPVTLTHDPRSDLRPFGIAGVLRSGGDPPWIACVWSWCSAHEKNCW